MIIDTEVLQEKCKKILDAIGTKSKIASDTLELEVYEGALYLNATDKEYFVSVKLPLSEPEEFHAVVKASRFLSLISKITTKTITLKVTSNYLSIKGNGNYKEPLIFNGDKLVELSRIEIDNVTTDFTIKNSILQSILKYNGKILYTDGFKKELTDSAFYVDNLGAITLSHSACINSFTLEQPVSLLLSEKLVKLFRLFKSDDIHFTMGFDPRPDGEVQQKVIFADSDVMLTAILTTDTQLISKFPVRGIRARADKVAPYSAVINKDMLLDAIERLSLFSLSDSSVFIRFTADGVFLSPENPEKSDDPVGEEVDFVNVCELLCDTSYLAKFNVEDLIIILETCEDKFLTLSFGDGALSIYKDNIKNMLPECSR